MSFTNEDLKRFREADVYPYTEPAFKALLARLEAAEKVVETCIEDYVPGNYVHELYDAWLKSAGREAK